MFTYFQSAVGALLFHAATSNFLYANGRVFGCSSIMYNSVFNPSSFNVPLLAGMALATLGIKTVFPQYLPDYSATQAIAPLGVYTGVVAGLLTGIGTKWGSGCTSGHMLCGLARLSPRSFVATMTFSSVAMVVSRLVGSAPDDFNAGTLVNPSQNEVIGLGLLAIGAVSLTHLLRTHLNPSRSSQIVVSVVSGILFGLGLLISGLASPAKTLGFLSLLTPKFDPSLAMVILFGIIPNALEIWRTGYNLPSGAAVTSFNLPTATAIPAKFICGAALFGIGWGLSGICPGPGFIASLLNGSQGLLWMASFLAAYNFAP